MGQKKPELVSLGISAWSLKARFALKHHAVRYTTTPYNPLYSEFFLRLRLGKWGGKLTVPVMLTPKDGVLLQSYDIAQWADGHSERPGAEQLFPPGLEEDVKRWNETSDRLLGWARIALTDELLADPAMLRKTVPGNVRVLGPLATMLTRRVVARLNAKYRSEGSSSFEEVLSLLREAQAAVKKGKDGYLVGGRLTYADMAMAVAVQVVKPLGRPFATSARPPLKAFAAAELQAEFAGLVAWRDSLFEKHWPAEDKGGRGKAS